MAFCKAIIARLQEIVMVLLKKMIRIKIIFRKLKYLQIMFLNKVSFINIKIFIFDKKFHLKKKKKFHTTNKKFFI